MKTEGAALKASAAPSFSPPFPSREGQEEGNCIVYKPASSFANDE